MKYADYQTRHRELRSALSVIREAAREATGNRDTDIFRVDPTFIKLDAELDGLYAGASRDYRISEACTVRLNFEFLTYVGVFHETRGNLMDFTYITPDELRLVADVKELMALFVTGAIDDLPPSGPWDPCTRRNLRNAKLAADWWNGLSTGLRGSMQGSAAAVLERTEPAANLVEVWNLRLVLMIDGPPLPEPVVPYNLDYFIATPTMQLCRKGHIATLDDTIWTCLVCGESAGPEED